MPTLDALQRYADKVADKLGLTDRPVLRWADKDCWPHRGAHCHITDGRHPRGTICLKRHEVSHRPIRSWHWLIAHEVTHLRVESHSAPAFARQMVNLGVANSTDRDRDKAGHKHRHVWSTVVVSAGVRYYQCAWCRATKDYIW